MLALVEPATHRKGRLAAGDERKEVVARSGQPVQLLGERISASVVGLTFKLTQRAVPEHEFSIRDRGAKLRSRLRPNIPSLSDVVTRRNEPHAPLANRLA